MCGGQDGICSLAVPSRERTLEFSSRQLQSMRASCRLEAIRLLEERLVIGLEIIHLPSAFLLGRCCRLLGLGENIKDIAIALQDRRSGRYERDHVHDIESGLGHRQVPLPDVYEPDLLPPTLLSIAGDVVVPVPLEYARLEGFRWQRLRQRGRSTLFQLQRYGNHGQGVVVPSFSVLQPPIVEPYIEDPSRAGSGRSADTTLIEVSSGKAQSGRLRAAEWLTTRLQALSRQTTHALNSSAKRLQPEGLVELVERTPSVMVVVPVGLIAFASPPAASEVCRRSARRHPLYIDSVEMGARLELSLLPRMNTHSGDVDKTQADLLLATLGAQLFRLNGERCLLCVRRDGGPPLDGTWLQGLSLKSACSYLTSDWANSLGGAPGTWRRLAVRLSRTSTLEVVLGPAPGMRGTFLPLEMKPENEEEPMGVTLPLAEMGQPLDNETEKRRVLNDEEDVEKTSSRVNHEKWLDAQGRRGVLELANSAADSEKGRRNEKELSEDEDVYAGKQITKGEVETEALGNKEQKDHNGPEEGQLVVMEVGVDMDSVQGRCSAHSVSNSSEGSHNLCRRRVLALERCGYCNSIPTVGFEFIGSGGETASEARARDTKKGKGAAVYVPICLVCSSFVSGAQAHNHLQNLARVVGNLPADQLAGAADADLDACLAEACGQSLEPTASSSNLQVINSWKRLTNQRGVVPLAITGSLHFDRLPLECPENVSTLLPRLERELRGIIQCAPELLHVIAGPLPLDVGVMFGFVLLHPAVFSFTNHSSQIEFIENPFLLYSRLDDHLNCLCDFGDYEILGPNRGHTKLQPGNLIFFHHFDSQHCVEGDDRPASVILRDLQPNGEQLAFRLREMVVARQVGRCKQLLTRWSGDSAALALAIVSRKEDAFCGQSALDLAIRRHDETVLVLLTYLPTEMKSGYPVEEVCAALNAMCPLTGHTPLYALLLYPNASTANLALRLMAARADPSKLGSCDSSDLPLLAAVKCGGPSLVRAVIEGKASVNESNSEGRSSLHLAVLRGSSDVLQELLRAPNCNIDATDSVGNTSLVLALRRGFTDMVRTIIASRCDVSVKDQNGAVPILSAVTVYDPMVGKLLLDRHADCNAVDPANGQHILLSALQAHNHHLALALLAARTDPNVRQKPDGRLPLHCAAAHGMQQIAFRLLALRVNVDAPDGIGDTSLRVATQARDFNIVTLLCDAYADVNFPNRAGCAPVHAAAASGDVALLQLLVSHSASIELKDVRCWTPLHYAAARGGIAIVKELLEQNAETGARSFCGRTPRDLAVAANNAAILRVLPTQAPEILALKSHVTRVKCKPSGSRFTVLGTPRAQFSKGCGLRMPGGLTPCMIATPSNSFRLDSTAIESPGGARVSVPSPTQFPLCGGAQRKPCQKGKQLRRAPTSGSPAPQSLEESASICLPNLRAGQASDDGMVVTPGRSKV